MSGLGIGMMSASHWAWMKWIDKPMGASHASETRRFVWTVALGGPRERNSKQRASLSPSWDSYFERLFVAKNIIVYQPSGCFVANFTRLYLFGGAAGRPSGRQPGVGALACSHLRADLQATGASVPFFPDAFCLVETGLPCEYICWVVWSAANKLSGSLCRGCKKKKNQSS